MENRLKGYLVLADGTVFQGDSFGATPTASLGEAVFNTGMTGYQEVLTDPSYCGQIVTMTYPLIGNYGINPDDFESRRPFVRGFVVKELCASPSHWQATQTLDKYLAGQGIGGLAGLDTRALTKHLRQHGTMNAALVTADATKVVAEAKRDLGAPGGLVARGGEYLVSVPAPVRRWLARQVSLAKSFKLAETVPEVTTPEPYEVETEPGSPRRRHVVVVDYGLKENILRSLVARGCKVTVVPAGTPAAEIQALRPAGIMLTNGPGDPTDIPEAIKAVRSLLTTGLPIFGICLGHQVLGLALGARTYKLPFGHRGANHPVQDLDTGQVYITSQNHGYAIDDKTLPPGLSVTHRNLNDGTVEGLADRRRPVFSVQYHPEAAPGPRESAYLFDRFMDNIVRAKRGSYAKTR